MAEAARHDAWAAGDAYDAFMGRWSRRLSARFLDWLALPGGLDWLELGAGTGALTEAILARCAPASVLAIEPSEGFLATLRARLPDPRIEARVGDAAGLPALPPGERDAAVAALVLNFVPDRAGALRAMARALRPGGTVAFHVWDYPGGGQGFLRAFWTEAVALDPGAQELREDRRFPFCTREDLLALAAAAGLRDLDSAAIEEVARFQGFDDFWRPFTLGAGPAPGYVASLPPEARERLRERLDRALPRRPDGGIELPLRAWAVRGRAA